MNSSWMQRMMKGEETECPCCGRFAQVYRRRLHMQVALQLIKLYRLGGHQNYIHTSELIPEGQAGSGDFSKAKYWKLIEEKDHTADNKKKSGYWCLSEHGAAFVRGHALIREVALVYDDRVLDYEGGEVTIQQCLGEKFNYKQLMEG